MRKRFVALLFALAVHAVPRDGVVRTDAWSASAQGGFVTDGGPATAGQCYIDVWEIAFRDGDWRVVRRFYRQSLG